MIARLLGWTDQNLLLVELMIIIILLSGLRFLVNLME